MNTIKLVLLAFLIAAAIVMLYPIALAFNVLCVAPVQSLATASGWVVRALAKRAGVARREPNLPEPSGEGVNENK